MNFVESSSVDSQFFISLADFLMRLLCALWYLLMAIIAVKRGNCVPSSHIKMKILSYSCSLAMQSQIIGFTSFVIHHLSCENARLFTKKHIAFMCICSACYYYYNVDDF